MEIAAGSAREDEAIRTGTQRRFADSGVTLPELIIVLAVSMIGVSLAVPTIRTAKASFQLNSATMATAGAIQSTRYQAIMKGYPFAITFNPATVSYQVSSKPSGAASFSNVGGPIEIAPDGSITLTPTTTLQLNPNGTVTATTGTLSFTMSNGDTNKTITVSGVGNVSITP